MTSREQWSIDTAHEANASLDKSSVRGQKAVVRAQGRETLNEKHNNVCSVGRSWHAHAACARSTLPSNHQPSHAATSSAQHTRTHTHIHCDLLLSASLCLSSPSPLPHRFTKPPTPNHHASTLTQRRRSAPHVHTLVAVTSARSRMRRDTMPPQPCTSCCIPTAQNDRHVKDKLLLMTKYTDRTDSERSHPY